MLELIGAVLVNEEQLHGAAKLNLGEIYSVLFTLIQRDAPIKKSDNGDFFSLDERITRESREPLEPFTVHKFIILLARCR